VEDAPIVGVREKGNQRKDRQNRVSEDGEMHKKGRKMLSVA
jgi:hypothetical protein